ncbi:MAG: hypothetical protein GF320_13220 [Armatimonadia bacterium]|nr:hypothetical protein [Armatimonadia bacterium]
MPPRPSRSEQAAEIRDLLSEYHPPGAGFDEVVDPHGELRPGWDVVLAGLGEMGREELNRRWGQAQRLLRENGITYNVYSSDGTTERPWKLDPLPQVYGRQEWTALSEAVEQRARLLEVVLADLYGEQRAIREGTLPSALILGAPALLRPCHGQRPSGDAYLHLYACDLVRGEDGQWRVVRDRTQAPAGAGYALENRIILTRALPNLFQQMGAERLAGFFRQLRETLESLAPGGRDEARVVVLTPGPYHESYFEHAYLARYLGYTLVEGGDLTVREDRLYLKTLQGLQRVDVVLRLQDDHLCDPIDLDPLSTIGVAGLVQAARSGQVAVANALGSGLAEHPALSTCLPALCQRFLGQELLLPSLATKWAGEPGQAEAISSGMDARVLRAAEEGGVGEPIGPWSDDEARRRMADELARRPWRVAAQDLAAFSSAPGWDGERITARPSTLRVFAVRTPEGRYVVMPGGLTKIAGHSGQSLTSLRRGGSSKDTWIPLAGADQPPSLLPTPAEAIEIRRSPRDVPSRVVDNLFWIGRYMQRAEGSVRLLRGVLARLATDESLDAIPELPSLLDLLTSGGLVDGVPEDLHETAAREELEACLLSAFSDPALERGLAASLSSLQDLVRISRDRLSLDTWRTFSRLEAEGHPLTDEQPADIGQGVDRLDSLIIVLSALSGLIMESMTRSDGWRFLDMGRRIERANQGCALIRALLAEPGAGERGRIEALLEVADSIMTYRSRYLTALQAAPALDITFVDETNPSSVAFQLARLQAHVRDLPEHPDPGALSPLERRVLRALSQSRLAEVHELAPSDGTGLRRELVTLMDEMLADLSAIADAIIHGYLVHLKPSRQMGRLEPEAR